MSHDESRPYIPTPTEVFGAVPNPVLLDGPPAYSEEQSAADLKTILDERTANRKSIPRTVSELAESGYRWEVTRDDFLIDIQAADNLRYKKAGVPGSGLLKEKAYDKRIDKELAIYDAAHGGEAMEKTRTERFKQRAKAAGHTALRGAGYAANVSYKATKVAVTAGTQLDKKVLSTGYQRFNSMVEEAVELDRRVIEATPGVAKKLSTSAKEAYTRHGSKLAESQLNRGAKVLKVGRAAIGRVKDVQHTGRHRADNRASTIGLGDIFSRGR